MTQSSEKSYTFVIIEPAESYIKDLKAEKSFKDVATLKTNWQQLWQTTRQTNSGSAIELLGIIKSEFLLTACFDQPAQALKAVIALQKAVYVEQAKLPNMAVNLRMALYSGPAQAQNNNFFGPTINRLSRLLQLAEPGQILLGASTQQAIASRLDQFPGVKLTDLGQLSLRAMVRPENIFQVVISGLPQNLSTLGGSKASAHNLPVQTNSLIGRQVEEKRLKEMLRRPDMRFISLTGPGGTGKTRLALEVARNLLPDFRDGVWLVNLATVRDPGLLTPMVAQVLGVNEAGSGGADALFKSLSAFLQKRSLLLLLDNFEQLIGSPARDWLNSLLNAAPGLKVLLTSHQRLNLAAEYEYNVPSLVLPTVRDISSAGQLNNYPAVQLFVERAKQVNPTFAVTDADAPAVAELVNELEGIPLAIELTAVRSQLFSARSILGQLSGYLNEVKGQQAASATQAPLSDNRALRGTLGWSFNLLEADEKRIFIRLSAFAGGCTAEAAKAVCNFKGDVFLDVAERLEMLIGKGFVQRSPQKGPERRYMLLETIRQYGLGLLNDYGETGQVMQEYIIYYITLARKAASELEGDDQAQWLKRLELEHDNFRAALEWLLQPSQQPPNVEMALQLAYALWQFWSIRGYFNEGRKWLERALTAAEPLGPNLIADEVRAEAFKAIGTLSSQQSDYEAAWNYYQKSLAILRRLGDKVGVARLLNNLGVVARERGDYLAARPLYEESLAQFRELKNQRAISILLNNLGLVAHDQHDYATARKFLEESLELARQQEDRSALALCLSSLADVTLDLHDYRATQTYLTESLLINRELNDLKAQAFILEYYSGLAAAVNQADLALRLAGAADQIREDIEAPLSQAEQLVLERRLQKARQTLGPAANLAWEAGHNLTLDQASALARTI